MRLWSVHPKYLDAQGLVALWREALLAQAVLRGRTRGYRHHPQLERFRAQARPLAAINAYLGVVYAESLARGYSFDRSKFRCARDVSLVQVTAGQVRYEWKHLRAKLAVRDPVAYRRCRGTRTPECNPLFKIVPGSVEEWERSN